MGTTEHRWEASGPLLFVLRNMDRPGAMGQWICQERARLPVVASMTESITAYLLRNGWQPVGLGVHSGKAAVLWNHDEPGLRSVNGFPVFRAEASSRQKDKDRREVGNP